MECGEEESKGRPLWSWPMIHCVRGSVGVVDATHDRDTRGNTHSATRRRRHAIGHREIGPLRLVSTSMTVSIQDIPSKSCWTMGVEGCWHCEIGSTPSVSGYEGVIVHS